MSTPKAGPRCPRCRRPLAAWRLDHCVYCGESFPPELKQGFEEPEGLKWVDRPELPPDLSKKLAMMKEVPLEPRKTGPSFMTIAAIIAVPIFAVVFFLLYRLVAQIAPSAALLVLAGGAGVVGYLIWIFRRASRKPAPTRRSS